MARGHDWLEREAETAGGCTSIGRAANQQLRENAATMRSHTAEREAGSGVEGGWRRVRVREKESRQSRGRERRDVGGRL